MYVSLVVDDSEAVLTPEKKSWEKGAYNFQMTVYGGE
jgi:hypothetical protein